MLISYRQVDLSKRFFLSVPGGWTWGRGYWERGGGAGSEGRGAGGRGGGKRGRDNINYLVKIITENKVFHVFRRNWMFFFYFLVVGNLSLSLSPVSLSVTFSVCIFIISISLYISFIVKVKSVDFSEEPNYNYLYDCILRARKFKKPPD